MTAARSIDPAHLDPTAFLDEQLAQASLDLLRSMVTTFVNALMSADADAVCGAPYGAASPERTSSSRGPGALVSRNVLGRLRSVQ